MLSYIIKQIIKKEETSISKLKTQHLKHRMWVPNSGFVSMLLIIRFWTQYKGQKMQDIKKNTNNKKMSSNITFILFLCTSDFFFFFFTHPNALLSRCHILCNCMIHFFIWFHRMQDWHSDFTEKIWFHNKGLKIRVFFPHHYCNYRWHSVFRTKSSVL